MIAKTAVVRQRTRWLIPGAVLAVSATFCFWVQWRARQANGGFGFPLDDAWIHLQFARNLHDYGLFSYYRDQMVTAGSTSPLYTLLLAAGFFVTRDEMALSYALGVLALCAAVYFFFRLAAAEFAQDLPLAAAAALLVALEPRLHWAALSGMETTLFIALLLAAAVFHRARRGVALGIALGALLWTRPEGLLFCGLLGLDSLYDAFAVRPLPGRDSGSGRFGALRWLVPALAAFAACAAAYVAFNVWLSGSLLPNTFAAKVKYYAAGSPPFTRQVFTFLTAGHMSALAVLALPGAVATLRGALGRRPGAGLFVLLWPLGLYLAYLKFLPYMYHAGRYLMPVLPFVILLGALGARAAVAFAARWVEALRRPALRQMAQVALLAVVVVQFASGAVQGGAQYAKSCRYVSDRQVRAALWIKERLPPAALVATHDVGAIAYYSERRIVDLVGLVSPEMIETFGDLPGLHQTLVRRGVTHLAVLRNWLGVVNQDPLFTTDRRTPEIMQVFAFDAARTWFTPQEALTLADEADRDLDRGDVRGALAKLEESIRLDARSGRPHLLLGRAWLMTGQLDRAETEFKTALQLHPTDRYARLFLAELAALRNAPQQAIAAVEGLLADNPSFLAAYPVLLRMYQAAGIEAARIARVRERYQQLLAAGRPGE